MTDKQQIAQLKRLVVSMHDHMDKTCTDYSMGPFDDCDECPYAVHSQYKCKRFEHFEKRMNDFGIKYKHHHYA